MSLITDNYLTVDQAAELWDRSKKSVYGYVKARLIPYETLSGRILFDRKVAVGFKPPKRGRK